MTTEPWFVSAFRVDYIAVYPHRDVATARREARHLIDRGVHGRTLDLCCGFGRHTLALYELGLDVVGLDLSADLLARAGALPGADSLRGRLLRADARAIPLATRSLESVVCLFSSFGYFGDDGDRRVLDEVARILRPGGLLVLDLMNPERVRRDLVSESRRESGGVVLEERRSLSDGGRRVEKQVRVQRIDGVERSWHESVRLYTLVEIESLLDAAGFDVARVEGDFEGGEHSAEAPRQILHARRR